MPDEKSTDTARTPNPNDTDAGAGSTGDDAGKDGRNDGDGAKADKELRLQIKLSQEKINDLERRVAEINARNGQSPAAREADADPPNRGGRKVNWDRVRDYAAAGDDLAAASLEAATKEELEQLGVGVSTIYRLLKIEDRQIRDAVEARIKKGEGFENAYSVVRTEKLEAENEDLRRSLAEAERTKPRRDAVRTEIREVPHSELKVNEMSGADFDGRLETLRREGRNAEALALQRDFRSGKITVKD